MHNYQEKYTEVENLDKQLSNLNANLRASFASVYTLQMSVNNVAHELSETENQLLDSAVQSFIYEIQAQRVVALHELNEALLHEINPPTA